MHSHSHIYYVYIMTNRSKTLYTGVTGEIEKRVFEHKNGTHRGFTSCYKIDRLVYFERFGDVHYAIAREKQIKGWLRIKKIALIVSMNPEWKDLSEGWFVRHKYQPEGANTQVLRRPDQSGILASDVPPTQDDSGVLACSQSGVVAFFFWSSPGSRNSRFLTALSVR